MSALHTQRATTSDHPFEALSAPERVELAVRESDFVTVTLYWTRGTDVVAVTVDDAKTGDSFELVVAENERPLDVFHHPFAYARARGIELLGDGRGTVIAADV